MRVRRKTIGFGLAALGAGALNYADPLRAEESTAPFVSNRSAARRVFPDLGDHDVVGASFEFQSPDGPAVSIKPDADGRPQVLRGDELLGPADPEAVDGIWASLRMATTLRAVEAGSDVGKGQGGVIRVRVDELELGITLGRNAPDGSGTYGVLHHEDDATWVVEDELLWLVRQPPEAWLSRSLAEVHTERLRQLAWGESSTLRRGDDGLWRVTAADMEVIVSTQAVELRLDRLLGARMDPLIPRQEVEGEARPWLLITTDDGETHSFVERGDCPGHPDRVLVDRGPGQLGCIDGTAIAPWNPLDADASMIESRLVPHAYAAVIGIELVGSERRRVRRRTGGWLLDQGERTVEVGDDAVYRWFTELSSLEVALPPQTLPSTTLPSTPDAQPAAVPFNPTVQLRFELGPNLGLLVSCDETMSRCARGEGPPLIVRGIERPSVAFDEETFAERQLVTLAPGDAHAIEVRGDAPTVRQAIRLDMGAWTLDAPAHPDRAGAIDEVRLESLLAVIAGARAKRWVDAPDTAPRRVIRVETIPTRGVAEPVEIALHDHCVAVVAGKRPAQLDQRSCGVFERDLLFDDPLRFWLDRARSATFDRAGKVTVMQRASDGTWRVEGQGAPSRDLVELLERARAMRSRGLVTGAPPSAALATVTIRRNEGADVAVDIGADWARIVGSPWFYAMRVLDSSAQRPDQTDQPDLFGQPDQPDQPDPTNRQADSAQPESTP